MPTASQRILLDFFQNDLQFTPTARQVDQFERDLALVSPDLMRAALKEAAASRGLAGRRFDEQRAAILVIYYRKVAEHAQLFPVFHTFETALRSTVAVELETHYQRQAWWTPVRDALRRGEDARSVPHLYGVALAKDTAHLIGQIIYAIEGPSLGKPALTGVQDGYAFAELCDLNHIGELLNAHWGVFSPRYFQRARPMTRNEFTAKFRAVRDARNDIYHHKSIARMKNVVVSAEEILNRFDCSLGFAYTKITMARAGPPTFAITQGGQHNMF